MALSNLRSLSAAFRELEALGRSTSTYDATVLLALDESGPLLPNKPQVVSNSVKPAQKPCTRALSKVLGNTIFAVLLVLGRAGERRLPKRHR
jgi:hypothetical protein